MASVSFERATRRVSGDATGLRWIRLDLTVNDGEFLVLVGPSGCGKSTSLRMVAGLEPLNSGRIHIGERDVTDVDPKDRDIAMVFQNYALYPHMTVAQNMGVRVEGRQDPEAADPRPGAATPRSCWTCSPIWTANPKTCPAVNVSGWRWVARSCAVRRCS